MTYETRDLFADDTHEHDTAPDCEERTAAPFRVGQGYVDRQGRAWIVAIEPVDTQGGTISRTLMIVGGPDPMAAIRWNITIAREGGAMAATNEHEVKSWRDASPIADHPDPAGLYAAAKAKKAETRDRMARAAEEATRQREASEAELARYAPAWAKAAIIAEYDEDASDTMSDYHNHRTTRVVVLGWSKHTRDLFPEMRKAAATFEDTAHLADAPESAEHREKYSMGAGFYLKDGWRDSTGWGVKKRDLCRRDDGTVTLSTGAADLEISDAAKGKAAPVKPAAPASGASNASGLFSIEQHTHTKRGFEMWIATMTERVERDDYNRFLAAAKALGGWYSRKWGTTPAGFAFKSAEAARQFVEGGDVEPGGDDASAPAAPGVADKLRTLADGMQAAIDGKFADRRTNTPKQQRQAAVARQDGTELERAQAIMRALADHHDAGTVPPILAGVTTKAAAVELAKEEIDRSNAGYYDAGIATGKPYSWPDDARRDKAAAAWALVAGADDERRAAEQLRQKVEGLQFAKIPGYFPTPADIIAEMLREADLPAGARVLEPSAGSGAIADAVREAGHDVDCVEHWGTLREILEAKGHTLIGSDFTEISPPAHPAPLYDAALMNPPFEKGQDCDHVARAWSFLKPGGVLVAIMGAGITFRSQRPYTTCRDWIEAEGGELRDIPAGAFKESGTGVASVMLIMHKD